MSEEHDVLLSKISQLAGQINRHKNQHAPSNDSAIHEHFPTAHQGLYAPVRGHGWHRPPHGTFPSRSRARGGRATLVTHHNRTLVLNNKHTGSMPAADVPATDSRSWVAKRDRHMQLISTAVYDQQVQARTQAMQKSLQERLRRREEREITKFKTFLKSQHDHSSSIHEVTIAGERYRVTARGSKLIKSDTNSATATPKKAVIGGVAFTRSKNGNLWRAGYVRATRSSMRPRKHINAPCKYFSNTGKCKHGMSCPYTHDPNKVAVCQGFLTAGSCQNGESCDLSHDLSAHRVPACHHFVRGNCSNANCRYTHVRVNPASSICREFATLGYCEKGDQCAERHVRECPDFDEKGVCNDAHCKLQHIERAGRRRVAAAAKNQESSDSDTSSDEGDPIDSDDVDSDAMSELDFAHRDNEHLNALQDDYIQL